MGRLTGGVLHSKFWVVDGQHVYVGSANMDWRSLTQVSPTAQQGRPLLELAPTPHSEASPGVPCSHQMEAWVTRPQYRLSTAGARASCFRHPLPSSGHGAALHGCPAEADWPRHSQRPSQRCP